MALVHVILLFGTNNVQPQGLTSQQIYHRSIGSRLVLASRIFYAAFIWMSKITVSEFLSAIAKASWRKSYERGLQLIRGFLVVTFVAVVIATLTECHPFNHYWQVVPDPGPRCRQGYAQLITMGVADVITDIVLVVWPIPIILNSKMTIRRKISLVGLFSLSLGLIAITASRVPRVIEHYGRQQYRTVWASAEILASAAIANAVVLGSFARDRGIKRNKYKRSSVVDSMERASTRRVTLGTTAWDSDEDLFRTIGCRIPEELRGSPTSPVARPAPVVCPASATLYMTGASPISPKQSNPSPLDDSVPALHLANDTVTTLNNSADSTPAPPSPRPPSPITVRSVSFFDVGGLLQDIPPQNQSESPEPGTLAQDFVFTPRRQSSRNIFRGLSRTFSSSPIRRRSSLQPLEPTDRERNASSASTDVAAVKAPSSHFGSQTPSPMAENWDTSINLHDVGGVLDK